MVLKYRLSISLLFLIAILAAILLKSLVLGLAITVGYLFYLSVLPTHITRDHAVMLPLAFILITILTYLDDDTSSINDLLSVGFFVVALFYTFGSFCVLSPLKMLPLNAVTKYGIMLCVCCLFAFMTRKSSQGIPHIVENTVLYFVYLSAVFSLPSLWKKKKVLAG